MRRRRHQRPIRVARRPDAPLGEVVHLKTWDYPGLVEAIEAAVPGLGARPRSVIACGAGPVVDRTLKLTNAPWLMDGQDAARRLGLGQGLLLNDFEAQALSLPTIPEDWARRIGPLAFGARGPQVILGPGTGLGIGALVHAGGKHTPLSSEACHIDFGPVTPEEWAIWPHLERVHGRITTESVISGPGLVRVHRARIAAPAPRARYRRTGPVSAALADRGGEEARSLEMFWRIVARFAGDMAVAFVAFGGVTLAGGVLPRLLDFLDEGAFRARSRPRRRSTRWRGGFPPGSSFSPIRCSSAWRRSPPDPAITPSTMARAAGIDRERRVFAAFLRRCRARGGNDMMSIFTFGTRPMARHMRGLLAPCFLAVAFGAVAPAFAQQDCGGDLQKLAEKRQAALTSINSLVAAAHGKQLDPSSSARAPSR